MRCSTRSSGSPFFSNVIYASPPFAAASRLMEREVGGWFLLMKSGSFAKWHFV